MVEPETGTGEKWVMPGKNRSVGEYVKQATQVLSQNQAGIEQSQVCQPGWYLSDKSVDRCVAIAFPHHNALEQQPGDIYLTLPNVIHLSKALS